MADTSAKKTFQFELVSPEQILVSEEATMVVIPGEDGEFGVLADHSPMLSSLRHGVVAVTAPDGAVKRIFVAGGFADVSATTCSVLAEEAVNVADINKADVADAIKNLEDDLGFAKADAIKSASIQKQIDIARAKLAA
jgi:F-type H+-transporting ATPase subunit epsilon